VSISICSAISTRAEVKFNYQGRERVVWLASHGYHAETGNELVRGYQVGGASSSSRLPDWRMFKVAHMGQIEPTGLFFSTLPSDYSEHDSHLRLHCTVQFYT
jgi:hypothetical protein